jgi:hypothetical protein
MVFSRKTKIKWEKKEVKPPQKRERVYISSECLIT